MSRIILDIAEIVLLLTAGQNMDDAIVMYPEAVDLDQSLGSRQQ